MNIQQLKNQLDDYKFKFELHAHTSPVSKCSQITPKRMIEAYKELGFSGVVITNHFCDYSLDLSDTKKAAEYYLKDYLDTKSEGEKAGINVFLGLEARFPQNANDYLVYGVTEEDVYVAIELLKYDIETFYKEFKTPDNLILQAHPFRNGMELANPEFIDGIEVFNMHPNHNSRVAVAAKYAAEHNNFFISGGTDFHHENQQGMCATCFNKMPQDSIELAKMLQQKDFVFRLGNSIVLP